MTDLNEKLSLLLDDYADDNAAATLDEVIGDVNLQYRTRRYRMIGEAMRHELPPAIDTGFHSAVMARIDDQAEAQTHSPRAQSPQQPAAKHSILSWVTMPLAGLAVAASVALVTVALWHPPEPEPGHPGHRLVSADQQKIQQLVEQQIQRVAVPGSTR